jgi:hypothetical protein
MEVRDLVTGEYYMLRFVDGLYANSVYATKVQRVRLVSIMNEEERAASVPYDVVVETVKPSGPKIKAQSSLLTMTF